MRRALDAIEIKARETEYVAREMESLTGVVDEYQTTLKERLDDLTKQLQNLKLRLGGYGERKKRAKPRLGGASSSYQSPSATTTLDDPKGRCKVLYGAW